jgi:uncharacterized protein
MTPPLGIGIGWRPEIDLTIERLPGVDFVEAIADRLRPPALPESLRLLRDRGVTVIPHGVGLGLGGAEPPDPDRLAHLAGCAGMLGAPFVSEHVAFVRAGGVAAGHLLPVPRDRECLDVLVDNVRRAQSALPVPLVLENVAALFGWPEEELSEAEFLGELVDRTGVGLLIDVANLHTNAVNQGLDPVATLAGLPLDALRYVHVAGGLRRDGVWHDTHTRAPDEDIYRVLAALCALTSPPGVMLEWDAEYPNDQVFIDTLGRIRSIVENQAPARAAAPPPRPRPGRSSSGSLPAARARLGERQGALLHNLLDGGPPPPGFEPERLRTQAYRLRTRHRHQPSPGR